MKKFFTCTGYCTFLVALFWMCGGSSLFIDSQANAGCNAVCGWFFGSLALWAAGCVQAIVIPCWGE